MIIALTTMKKNQWIVDVMTMELNSFLVDNRQVVPQETLTQWFTL